MASATVNVQVRLRGQWRFKAARVVLLTIGLVSPRAGIALVNHLLTGARAEMCWHGGPWQTVEMPPLRVDLAG